MNVRGWLALALVMALAWPTEAQSVTTRKMKKKQPVAEETTPEAEAPAAAEEAAPADTDAAPPRAKRRKPKKPHVPEPEAEGPVEEPLAGHAKEPPIPPAMPDEPAPAPRREPRAALKLVVPAGKRVRAVTFYLEDALEKAEVEDQTAADPDSILNIGRGRATEIGFKGEKVQEKRRALEDVSVIFYVFSGVVKLKEFEVRPDYFKKGDDLDDTGETPPVWRIEVLAMNRIGDTDGRVLKTLDDQPLKIGEVNTFPLDVEIPAGKKVGVRLSLPPEKKVNKAVFLQLKAARKGKFPANVLTSGGEGEPDAKVLYNPSVRFTFVPRAGDIDTFTNQAESLVGQINRYVEKHGRDVDEVTVPLKVRVEYR